MTDTAHTVRVAAEAHVFGHDPAPASLSLAPRTTGWRAARAAPWLLGGLVLAPVAGVVPPHAPWAVGALAGGVVLGLRKWRERFTLLAVDGPCPRCGEALGLSGPTPLRVPHPLSCDGCGNPVRIEVDPPES